MELFQSKISELSLSDEVTLAGSFCTGRCNREGVTVIIDDEVFTGLTPEKFDGFFDDNVLKKAIGGIIHGLPYLKKIKLQKLL